MCTGNWLFVGTNPYLDLHMKVWNMRKKNKEDIYILTEYAQLVLLQNRLLQSGLIMLRGFLRSY